MKTHHIRNNWKPVIGSLVHKLVKAGFTLTAVDDGEERIKVRTAKEAVEAINAVDDSHLFLTKDFAGKPVKTWLFIVLGNEPEETVADYSITELEPELEAVLDAFAARWEGVRVPKIKVPLTPAELAREA